MRRNPNRSRWLIRTYDRTGDLVQQQAITTTRPVAMHELASMTRHASVEFGLLYPTDASGRIAGAIVARAEKYTAVSVYDARTRSTREYKFG